MSDKERLADIKSRYMEHEYDFNLKNVDIKWLIKQAERVGELEKFKQEMEDRYKIWHIGAKKSLAEKEQLLEQNQRYKHALEFYADENNYREQELKGIVPPRPITFKPILHDYGSIARQALEEEI